MLVTVVLGLLASYHAVSALLPPPPPPTHNITFKRGLNPHAEHFFDQLIDHSRPSLGTFKQRYWFSDEFYTQPGAPIVIHNPGEQSASGFSGYLTSDTSLQRAIMLSLGAAGVILEHRYWGESSPYQVLSAENLKYLTVTQAIRDTKYFVAHVKLPWSNGKSISSHHNSAPWVNLGCSYPGLLSAYTQEKYSTLFAAAWASSAPVQADSDFWEYYEPIEQGMPKNCSSDVALAIKQIDHVLSTGSAQDQTNLKQRFSLEALGHDDFARSISYPIYSWQGLSAWDFAYTGEADFFKWCDAIETLPNGQTNTKAKGVGLDTALANYARYYRQNWGCPASGGSCYTSYDYSSYQYTDWSVENLWNRQWTWMTCTEFGWFQDGDPGNYSSIVSSFVTEAYQLRQCNHMFPHADGSLGHFRPQVARNNHRHKGWNLRARHLFVVNGEFDPWRSASLSSSFGPKYKKAPHQQVEVIKGGHHCWDFSLLGARYNPDVKRVVDKGIKALRGWVKDWYKDHPKVKNSMPKKVPNYWGPILP